MTIDRDRDYLLSVIIDLNTTLTEYKNAYAGVLDKLAEVERQKASLVESSGQSLATAEGWKKKYHEAVGEIGGAWRAYYDLLRAARKDAGWSRTKSYLRHLGLPGD